MTHDNAQFVCHNQAYSSICANIMLQIHGECELEANRKDIWPLILDPDKLAILIPGCRSLEEQEQGYYRGRIQIGIAGLAGTYETFVRVVESIPPKYCRFSGEVYGKSGLITGDAELNLMNRGSSCRIKYNASGIVTGALSKINPQYINGIAQSFINLGISRLDRQFVSQGDTSLKENRGSQN
jgi:carbon monoxide dehydrogenase subunit G